MTERGNMPGTHNENSANLERINPNVFLLKLLSALRFAKAVSCYKSTCK